MEGGGRVCGRNQRHVSNFQQRQLSKHHTRSIPSALERGVLTTSAVIRKTLPVPAVPAQLLGHVLAWRSRPRAAMKLSCGFTTLYLQPRNPHTLGRSFHHLFLNTTS